MALGSQLLAIQGSHSQQNPATVLSGDGKSPVSVTVPEISCEVPKATTAADGQQMPDFKVLVPLSGLI
eukprot:scaffold452094_cov42-Prasinocladus_malaysianus.AAC.1